jgi:uncharacterized glyoxalase superfamily protein PhnB
MVDAPDVVPMIAYQDGPAAMDWLAAAFGFREQTRWVDDDGVLSHGEMVAGQGLVMLATPTRSMKDLPSTGRSATVPPPGRRHHG